MRELPDTAAAPSFWHRRNPASLRPPLPADLKVDVAIAGGGMTGLTSALCLAEAGLTVCVLEAGRIAGAATGRNVGFVMEGVAESYSRTVALWGRERARRARSFTVHNHRLLRERLERHGIDCGYQQRGTLHLAASAEEAQELADSTALLAEDGFDVRAVASADLPAWARDGGYVSGQIVGLDGELDPVAFARGLARAAEQAGVALHERCAVDAIDPDEGGVTVHACGLKVRAEAAVVAANAYAGRLFPWLDDRIDPTRGQVLVTEPLAERIFHRPIYASHGFEYWRQLVTGEVVLGGWRNLDVEGEVGYENLLHPGIQAALDRFVRGIHPALADVAVAARWSGIMGFSRDSLPIVGPLPGHPRVVLASGFTGHGFGFAVASGGVVADVITQGRSAWDDLLAPRRL